MAKPGDVLEQVRTVWSRLAFGQRVGFLAALLMIGGGVAGTVFWASRPEWRQIAAGVGGKEAGKIMTRLDGDGIKYKMQGDSTILVDAADFERARASLSKAGLGAAAAPAEEENSFLKSGMNKSELQFAQTRQIEARLSQKLSNFDFLESAQVTITPAGERYFKQGRTEAKASVLVKAANPLSETQIESIVHTVAGGVDKLSPEQVAVVDSNGVVLRQPASGDIPGARSPNLSYQLSIERHKESQAQAKLDMVYGPRKVAVTVSVEIDWDRRQDKETKYDIENFAVTEKTVNSSTRQGDSKVPGGRPGVASAANGSSQTAGSKGSESKDSTARETRQYGTTETELVKMGGSIKRLSVGVFVDQTLNEQVEAIKKTIEAAVGVDAKRGDTIEVAVSSFATAPAEAPGEDRVAAEKKATVLAYVEYGVWIVLGIGFLVFALRTMKKAQRSLHAVLERSLVDEEDPAQKPRETPIEEVILEAVKKDTDLAGRSLRRWLYESARS